MDGAGASMELDIFNSILIVPTSKIRSSEDLSVPADDSRLLIGKQDYENGRYIVGGVGLAEAYPNIVNKLLDQTNNPRSQGALARTIKALGEACREGGEENEAISETNQRIITQRILGDERFLRYRIARNSRESLTHLGTFEDKGIVTDDDLVLIIDSMREDMSDQALLQVADFLYRAGHFQASATASLLVDEFVRRERKRYGADTTSESEQRIIDFRARSIVGELKEYYLEKIHFASRGKPPPEGFWPIRDLLRRYLDPKDGADPISVPAIDPKTRAQTHPGEWRVYLWGGMIK
jgi:hypothetical protein